MIWKKVTVKQLLMEIEQFENCRCFSPFLGDTESDSQKSTEKGPKSDPVVFKIVCQLYIAKWRCPPNLKRIGEVMDFECTFSVGRAIYKKKYRQKS